MRSLTLSTALSIVVALAGCATLAPLSTNPGPSLPQSQPAFEPGDLVLRLRIGDSRTLQAGGDPVVYNASNVDYLVITPYIKVGDAFEPMSTTGKPTTEGAADRLKVTTTDRFQTYFVFKNLPPDQTYRFQAQAYDTQHNLISKDAESVTEVTFTRFEYMNTPTLPLKLKDTPFMATATTHLRLAGTPTSHHEVRLTLSKGEQTVGTLTVPKAQLPNNIVLGGLAPRTTYTLLGEALDAGGQVLATASVTAASTTLPTFTTSELSLFLPARVETYAGSVFGNTGTTLDDALFSTPRDVVEHDGRLYVAEYNYGQLRMIDPQSRAVSMLERSYLVSGLVFDSTGALYYSNERHQIMKITQSGGTLQQVLFAGSSSRDSGYLDGQGSDARFNGPTGLVVDSEDNLYVADRGNHRIRKVSPSGEVTTFAGSTVGFADGTGTDARFSAPWDLAIDGADNLYVVDANNNRIRKITPDRVVTTLAGSGAYGIDSGEVDASVARFATPQAIAVSTDGSRVYVVDRYALRQFSNGKVLTLAGSGQYGTGDGKGSAAQFNTVWGMTLLSDGNLMIADTGNNLLRKVILP